MAQRQPAGRPPAPAPARTTTAAGGKEVDGPVATVDIEAVPPAALPPPATACSCCWPPWPLLAQAAADAATDAEEAEVSAAVRLRRCREHRSSGPGLERGGVGAWRGRRQPQLQPRHQRPILSAQVAATRVIRAGRLRKDGLARQTVREGATQRAAAADPVLSVCMWVALRDVMWLSRTWGWFVGTKVHG